MFVVLVLGNPGLSAVYQLNGFGVHWNIRACGIWMSNIIRWTSVSSNETVQPAIPTVYESFNFSKKGY